MKGANSKLRLNFSTKVLLPVVSFLIVVPALILWLGNRWNTQQALEDAELTLQTAKAVFTNSLDIHRQNLLLRHRIVVNESRVKVVLDLHDVDTATILLKDLLNESGEDAEVFLFTTPENSALGHANKKSSLQIDEFRQAVRLSIEDALGGESNVQPIAFAGDIFDVVSVPVFVGEELEGDQVLEGVLTVGVRLTKGTVEQLKSLTQTEIVLFCEGEITVSTLNSLYDAMVMEQIIQTPQRSDNPDSIILDGDHYLTSAGPFASASAYSFGFLLLSSYEDKLRALETSRTKLLWISLAGMCLSTGIVWWLIRRITRPLVQLRDSAKAVGLGDFSHRTRVLTNDECGDLANAFNHMTENLKNSRSELQKTVETLRTTQAQLIQSEKLSAVGQFVAGIAHELNNPLTTLFGFSELLKETSGSETQRGYLDHVIQSAERCRKIVKNLLSFSRQQAPERRSVDVNELIIGVFELLTYEFRTGDIQLIPELASDLPRVSADSSQLQQVFLSILGNARQAIEAFRPNGRILALTRKCEIGVSIEFHDNGPGISRDNLSRIFDPFFTTKPVGYGTGLGLSVSYGIVQEHGGTITAKSEIGEGAIFIIELPAAAPSPQESASPAATTPHEPEYRPAGTGHRVLVIDDEEWMLKLATEVLMRAGYEVETAIDGHEGLQALQKGKFDAILCDWKMPGLSGPHVYEKLQQERPDAAQRFAMMTGNAISESFQRFLEMHSLPCLPKPFSLQEFRAMLGRIMKSP